MFEGGDKICAGGYLTYSIYHTEYTRTDVVYGSYTLTETDTQNETENFMELGNGLKPLYFPRPRTVRNFDIRRIILGICLSVCVGQYELAIHHQVYLYSQYR